MIVMAVGNVDVIDRGALHGFEKGVGIEPPLRAEARAGPPGIGEDAQTFGFDEN